ncbi:MerR family transcriptional regulator [Shimazuella alba]|uniref:MerR family transcriptional regulator n=1 Tax=Shimazuella alba TaxID=2690964 RepID=A0A6I4VVD9_9BACL|nr:MerR family transcriptional regulator [Shimazuella alba]MXQ53786.1 MerR family transcriptional regulator [Shimazuella alba]
MYTVGELAKIAGVTVRTIQYYDHIHLLAAKRKTNKNSRFYTENDLVKLQQILFYKKIGMSLNDIKKYLVHHEDNNDLKHMLKIQKEILFKKEMEIKTSIAVIDAILSTIDIHELYDLEEMIKVTINLNKDSIFTYANIDFDPETTSVFQDRFTDDGEVVEVYWRWKRLVLEAFCLIKNHIKPESKAGYQLGEKWHAFVHLATNNSPEIMEAYTKTYKESHLWPTEDKFLMDYCVNFMEKAHQYYLTKKDD